MASTSTSNLTLASNISEDAIYLINKLSSMVASCPVCQSKLLNQKKNNAGVTSSSQTGHADTTAPGIGMLSLNEREERTST